tara:strand:- start:179160 stop:180203 length:1044 start_codon:yes stop_codon:yes gene_type:complete
MIKTMTYWYKRYFTDPGAGQLAIALILFFVIVTCLSNMLAPVFFSIVIAYLLEWGVSWLIKCKFPRWLAVVVMFILFVGIVVLLLFGLMPLIVQQLNSFIKELPQLTAKFQTSVHDWINHSTYISPEQVQKAIISAKSQVAKSAQDIVTHSISFIPSLITFIVYFVMVPLLVYFFLMDKKSVLQWSKRFIPQRQHVLTDVWNEVHKQIGNYVRGKVLEAFIVAVMAYIAFMLFGLQYALLLAAAVGISVFVPYIGAVVVTIPVAIIAMIQFGFSAHFLWLAIVYGIILALDGTVIVAVLFSGTNNLHPIIIIVATLVFGGLWGFWGVFFAIPLASLFKAVMEVWPRT